MGVFVYLCVDFFMSMWMCLCVSEEKEDEERRSQFVLHGEERDNKV